MKTQLKLRLLWRALFGDPVRAFGTMSLVFLVSLAIAPAKDYFSEWRHYQKQYVHLIRGRGEAVSLERRFQPGLQQIWIPEQNVVDRCTTCHLAMKETSLAGSAQPFRPHPAMPHSPTEFGCVTCHRGQGAATTVEEAHRSTLAWEQPILPAGYMEASCGQCHLSALPGTPQLNLGRDLLAREGCARCHVITQPGSGRMSATDDPPSLAHVASKTGREWIYAWAKDPQTYSALATMPNFGLSDDDARDVTAFLMAQSAPLNGVGPGASPASPPPGAPLNAPTASATTAPDAAASQAGASLYGQLFCASCHSMQNAAGMMVGGNIGPELTRAGSKLSPAWLGAWLRNPVAIDPQTRMPHYRLDEQQIGLLSGFLQAKTDGDLLANVHLPDSTPQQAAHGRTLVIEYGCASCHEINGVPKPENLAPDLSHIGGKPMAQIPSALGVPPTLHDYIAAKIRNPRVFGANLKMPRFKLTDHQVDALTTALLALTDRGQSQPANFRTGVTEPSHYQPAGKAGQLIDDVRCFTCHKINGRGGDMAPDLSWEGSAVQRAWLEDFLKNPNTLRPALIRRMPKFNLTPDEIKTLSDYIMTVYQTPAFDRDSMPASSFTPALVEQGRQLFYSRYGCQSCHILDPAKDKGYIGPTLTQAGTRLDAPWIYNWLKNPQALRPGAIEPNQHISDNDAQALTAFLMSLKGGAAPRPAAEAKKK